jgi:hypothetical protein
MKCMVCGVEFEGGWMCSCWVCNRLGVSAALESSRDIAEAEAYGASVAALVMIQAISEGYA